MFMKTLEEQSPSTNQVWVLLGRFDSILVAAGLKKLGKEAEKVRQSIKKDAFDKKQYIYPSMLKSE